MAWDDDIEDHEASTYPSSEHGPEPVPDWVITEGDARQYERGLLNTGKEEDVLLCLEGFMRCGAPGVTCRANELRRSPGHCRVLRHGT